MIYVLDHGRFLWHYYHCDVTVKTKGNMQLLLPHPPGAVNRLVGGADVVDDAFGKVDGEEESFHYRNDRRDIEKSF